MVSISSFQHSPRVIDLLPPDKRYRPNRTRSILSLSAPHGAERKGEVGSCRFSNDAGGISECAPPHLTSPHHWGGEGQRSVGVGALTRRIGPARAPRPAALR